MGNRNQNIYIHMYVICKQNTVSSFIYKCSTIYYNMYNVLCAYCLFINLILTDCHFFSHIHILIMVWYGMAWSLVLLRGLTILAMLEAKVLSGDKFFLSS